jgi:extradiol dioxygenase family protein
MGIERWRVSRSVIAKRRAAMVPAMAMPGTARDPLRSHSFTQCRSALAHERRGGDEMLAKHPIDVMLMATDLEAARHFYGDRVGLDVLIESDDFVTFGCGGDSRLVVTRTSSASGEQQTKASWRVTDVVAEVAELRARGVDVVEYDEPYLKTVDGVADVGFALSAWFVDPGGNTIGLLQFKDKGSG